MARHRLTDEQWELIGDIFPAPAKTGRPPADRRDVVDGIFWILRTGAPWRDLPEEFEKWKTVYHLYNKWNQDGTLDKILDRLRSTVIAEGKLDQELWCIDGTAVRAARCAGGARKKTKKTT